MRLFLPSADGFARLLALVWVGLPVALSAQETTTAALESLVFRTLEFREPAVA